MTRNTAPRPCRYCGYIAARGSDEDCPAKLSNRWRAFLRALCERMHQ